MKPIKVLHVNTVDGGGAAAACLRLHEGLLKEGVESDVLVLEKGGSAYSRVHPYWQGMKGGGKRFLKKQWAHYHREWDEYRIKKRPQGYERYSFCSSPFDITQHPLYKQADIINLHWVACFLDYPSFFKNNTKPVVWTMHDMAPFSGGYHYLEGFPVEAYQDWIGNQERKKIDSLEGQDLHIVGVSNWLQQLSEQSNVFGTFPHYSIPYGLNTNIFTEREKTYSKKLLNIPQDIPVLLFVAAGLENKRKGMNLLLAALDELEDKPMLLLLAGDYTKVELPKNKQYLQTKSLGMVRDELMMSLVYSSADLFVIPSIEDNLPNTVIESLCCGTPVVGFPIGGVPDMVKDGFNGILAKDLSVNALKNAINKGLETGFLRADIRTKAAQKYSDQRQANDYIALYQKALNIESTHLIDRQRENAMLETEKLVPTRGNT